MPAIDELESAAQSIVTVESERGFGAGSIIAHVGINSYVLTCAHVVLRLDNKVTVTYRVGRRFVRVTGRVERFDEETDLALVRTARRIPLDTIELAADAPDCYSRVYGIGTGSSIPGLAFEGILSSCADQSPDHDYIYTGLAVSGMSGGALIDEEGELIGVIKAVDRNGHLPVWTIGYAVTLPKVKAFLSNRSKFAKSLKSR